MPHAVCTSTPAAPSAAADDAAFAASLDRQRAYLVRAARLKLRDAGDVQDVVQETLIAAWNGRAVFGGRSSLRTWLVGILNHKIVDAIRERARHSALSLDALDGDAQAGESIAQIRHDGADAATLYERRALCAQALAELESHSPKAARIFMLREIDGEPTPAICRRMNVSHANCYVLLHRARQFLQQRFAGEALAA